VLKQQKTKTVIKKHEKDTNSPKSLILTVKQSQKSKSRRRHTKSPTEDCLLARYATFWSMTSRQQLQKTQCKFEYLDFSVDFWWRKIERQIQLAKKIQRIFSGQKFGS